MAMEPFGSASHQDVLRLLVQISILLFVARTCGQMSRRFGQPAVVGEILAGILLGPSVLSSLFPALGRWIVPQTGVQGFLLELVSLFGAMFLMLMTGLETDLGLIRRHARTVFGVSLCGIAVTFGSGYWLGMSLPSFLLGTPDERIVFALFLGTAMAISAIAVIGKILIDLDLTRRDIGQTLIAAGMSDDTIGWILLSVVVSLAGGHAVTAATVTRSAVAVLAFIALSLTLGIWVMKKLVDFVLDKVTIRERFVTLVVVMMFVWGALAMTIHLEAVLGAFIIGIAFGQLRRLPEEVPESLEGIAIGIFAPIFFAVAGLKVNLRHLLEPRLILVALLIIVVTGIAKATGTYLGARVVGRQGHWYALSFSAGLNTRGAMDIIIASIGLSLGVFSQDMFSIVVLMAMTNSLLAPAALKWVLQHVTPSDEELSRLEKERKAEESVVAGIHRVLLPIRLRDAAHISYSIEGKILQKIASSTPIALTLLTITKQGERQKAAEFLAEVSKRFPQSELVRKVVVGSSPSEIILDEVEKEYDLLVLGASEDTRTRVVFNPMVDYLIRVSPCPTMVVRGTSRIENWQVDRILVPNNGSMASRRAAELAFAMASGDRSKVIVLNVSVKQMQFGYRDVGGRLFQSHLASANQIVKDLEQLGRDQGADVDGIVRVGRDPEHLILDYAKREAIDLIILGTDLRPGSQRLFLGPKVERILNNASCPVVIFNAS